MFALALRYQCGPSASFNNNTRVCMITLIDEKLNSFLITDCCHPSKISSLERFVILVYNANHLMT